MREAVRRACLRANFRCFGGLARPVLQQLVGLVHSETCFGRSWFSRKCPTVETVMYGRSDRRLEDVSCSIHLTTSFCHVPACMRGCNCCMRGCNCSVELFWPALYILHVAAMACAACKMCQFGRHRKSSNTSCSAVRPRTAKDAARSGLRGRMLLGIHIRDALRRDVLPCELTGLLAPEELGLLLGYGQDARATPRVTAMSLSPRGVDDLTS